MSFADCLPYWESNQLKEHKTFVITIFTLQYPQDFVPMALARFHVVKRALAPTCFKSATYERHASKFVKHDGIIYM